jgi:hypothetical protein
MLKLCMKSSDLALWFIFIHDSRNYMVSGTHCFPFSVARTHPECPEPVHVKVSSWDTHPSMHDSLWTCSDNHFFRTETRVQYSIVVVHSMHLQMVQIPSDRLPSTLSVPRDLCSFFLILCCELQGMFVQIQYMSAMNWDEWSARYLLD